MRETGLGMILACLDDPRGVGAITLTSQAKRHGGHQDCDYWVAFTLTNPLLSQVSTLSEDSHFSGTILCR